MGHCQQCDDYEAAVMDADAPADVEATPCDDYEMSGSFKDWMVDRMRGEVLAQISGAGLDRMAILKADDAGDADDQSA